MSTSDILEGPVKPTRTIYDAVEARIPSRLALASKLVSNHANTTLYNMTVGNVMGGMRGLPCMLWEISGTENATIKYHGKSMEELQPLLPRWPGSRQPAPEGMIWYLYTAAIPTHAELVLFTQQLVSRSFLPTDVEEVCDLLPSNLSPTTQVVMGLAALSHHSKLNAALERGVARADMWRHALDDALSCTAVTPMLAARIYTNKYHQGRDRSTPLDPDGDMAQNFAIRLGKADDAEFIEFIRLSWTMHLDHGASISSHSMRLNSSAWSDPYYTLASGLMAAAGVLHGGAILQSVRFMLDMSAALGPNPSPEAIADYVRSVLRRGQIVPGYGHALLRQADPRLAAILRFTDSDSIVHGKRGGGLELMKLIERATAVIPEVLRKEMPKIKNPEPNVDSLSGSVLHAFGLEVDFVMVVPALSRGMGFMAQYVWDHALRLPLERPLTLTMDQIVSKL